MLDKKIVKLNKFIAVLNPASPVKKRFNIGLLA